MAVNEFILRSTGEEVEVIAFNLVENGARTNEDWVTYIDSKGKEHIKEPLSIQLDFKAKNNFTSMFNKAFEHPKYPSIDNTRLYELTKELIIHRGFNVDNAISIAEKVVAAVKED